MYAYRHLTESVRAKSFESQKYVRNMSNYISNQDDVSAHTANATQLLCRESLKTF